MGTIATLVTKKLYTAIGYHLVYKTALAAIVTARVASVTARVASVTARVASVTARVASVTARVASVTAQVASVTARMASVGESVEEKSNQIVATNQLILLIRKTNRRGFRFCAGC